ncbi:MAG: hypothetical protein QJ16_C0007G0033 [archaeon GW2011_AR1]|nr:MAG: hypothetical protein QJ16_C0007G0033 [archaeon GW2011_AR1]
MKILEIKNLEIPDIKVIKFARFCDERGYFTEQFRKSDLIEKSGINSLMGQNFFQANHSYSKKGVVRGLHFQWNPYMGKLVRTLSGHMVDMILDIRRGSPTEGKIIAYDMPASNERNFDEWVWIPPGFAHGNFFPKNSNIEYLCTGEYSQGFESGIFPLSRDLDWSLCNSNLKDKFDSILSSNLIISDKDKNAQSFSEWKKSEKSENFVYSQLKKDKFC